MFLLRVVLNILVRNASPRGPMCFRCLIFNLSGPCELLFLSFGMFCLSAISMMFVKIMLAVCMLVGMVV